MTRLPKSSDLFDWKPTKRQTRTDQLLDAFAAFHLANPRVWRLFKRFALDVISSGQINYSANAIFERIRWHMEIETKSDEVKLNNNFRAYYARMFHLAYPQHEGFFRNRRLTSEDVEAYRNDVQVFDSGQPSEEETITERLSDILQIEQ